MAREISRRVAAMVLTQVYSGFYRTGRPEFLFEKARAVWGQFNSSGKFEVDGGRRRRPVRIVNLAAPCKEKAG